ncbi:MAG: hypothetical protein K2W96_24220 [Gemmataceae bacterium]|nr:hypothetical protein [Gemmataceae bacterium]
MRLPNLLRAVSTGILTHIPILGPILQSILAERGQASLEQRLDRLVEELADPRRTQTVLAASPPNLLPALLMAEAEADPHPRLERTTAPRRRWLYLAARTYASAARTAEIAVTRSFLWRTHHASNGIRIPNVMHISVGDLIALGYRTNGGFRVLLPLLVLAEAPGTIPIPIQYSPFVRAGEGLSEVLQAEGYLPDPVLGYRTGLCVRPLYADVADGQARDVLQGTFPSPGKQSGDTIM